MSPLFRQHPRNNFATYAQFYNLCTLFVKLKCQCRVGPAIWVWELKKNFKGFLFCWSLLVQKCILLTSFARLCNILLNTVWGCTQHALFLETLYIVSHAKSEVFSLRHLHIASTAGTSKGLLCLLLTHLLISLHHPPFLFFFHWT